MVRGPLPFPGTGRPAERQHPLLGCGDGHSRSRRRRGRERTPTSRASGRNEPDTTILEDDVLVPAAGILDVLENYAFVRTSGYLPGTDDVYLSLSMVKKYGLRRGDAVVVCASVIGPSPHRRPRGWRGGRPSGR